MWKKLILHWFLSIFIEFHWFSIDFHWFSIPIRPPRWKCISIFLGPKWSKIQEQNPSKKKNFTPIFTGNQKNIYFIFQKKWKNFRLFTHFLCFFWKSYIFMDCSSQIHRTLLKILQNLSKIIQNDNKNA